jgi:DNA modification methylase
LNGKRTPDILQFKKTLCKQHPTEKPQDLLEHLILKSTQPEELVLDPFAGSFSTFKACLKTDRSFVGCEINGKYVELAEADIKTRLDRHTPNLNQKARQAPGFSRGEYQQS